MNESPAGLPKIFQAEVAKLGYTHVLIRLLGDHGLFQATPNTAPRVRCGRVFVKEPKLAGEEQDTAWSPLCTIKISLPAAGAFFQLLCLLCDYMCERPEFTRPHRSSERLKFFIPRK